MIIETYDKKQEKAYKLKEEEKLILITCLLILLQLMIDSC